MRRRSAVGSAVSAARSPIAQRRVDHVAGHDPVRRVLATGHPHEAVLLGVTRCSRDALTVVPPDGAISGRSPEYVPTTSSARRSTSIAGSPSRAAHRPRGRSRRRDRARLRCVGRADQPVTRPRDEEHDLARDADASARHRRDPRRGGRRGARRGSAGSASSRLSSGTSGRPPRRRSRRRPRGPGRRARRPDTSVAGRARRRPGRSPRRRPVAATRVRRRRAPDGSAVRSTASAYRASSWTASWIHEAAAQPVRRRAGACSSVLADVEARCQPPSRRAPEDVVERHAAV